MYQTKEFHHFKMTNKRKLYILIIRYRYIITTILYVINVKMDEFTLTKQVAKPGRQGIIVPSKILEDDLCSRKLLELKIKILKKPKSA